MTVRWQNGDVVTILSYESQLVRRRAPCFDPLGQSMLHPDGSGMKHGARETQENHLGFVSQTGPPDSGTGILPVRTPRRDDPHGQDARATA